MPIKVKFSKNTYTEQFKSFSLERTLGELKAQIWNLPNAFTDDERRSKNLKLKIVANGKTFTSKDDSKTLKELTKAKFKNSKVTFTVTIDSKGGTQMEKTFPTEVLSHCKKTTCRIMQTTNLCYKVSCGCWVSFDGIRGEVNRLYRISFQKLECTVHDKEWDMEEVLYICNLDDNTEEMYETEFTKRSLGADTTTCPKCGTMGTRDITVTLHRIACGRCGLNYCLHCEKKWTGSGMELCGNKDCDNYDIQDNLDNCPDVSHSSPWVKQAGGPVPELRACPKCIQLITHSSACQHMTCPTCKYDFCFICLQPWYNNKKEKKVVHIINGTTYNNGCKIAPRQKLS